LRPYGFDASRLELFGLDAGLQLSELIIPEQIPGDGLFKCRIIYDREVHQVSYSPYILRSISSIFLCEAGDYRYDHKFLDRNRFDEMRRQLGPGDELILMRSGEITDSCFSNLAFSDGSQWFTPEQPLLRGTRRQRLLDSGRMVTRRIFAADIDSYQKISLINAMLDLEMISVATTQIRR
jgi:4-amino-4-deoxychorismate lyase